MTQYPKTPFFYELPQEVYEDLLPMERQLLFRKSVEAHLKEGRGVLSVKKSQQIFLTDAVQGMGQGLGWLLLEHLAEHPLFVKGGPLLELDFVQGIWQWRSVEAKPEVTGLPVNWAHLDVVRIQRLMQLLGLLDHSRREEWERGVLGR